MQMLWTVPLAIFLLVSAAHADEGGMGWGRLFDGLRGKSIEQFIPSLPLPDSDGGIRHWQSPEDSDDGAHSSGARIPKVGKSGPIDFDWLSYRDAFQGRKHCGTVDVVYVKQPALDEALESLNRCLADVSKGYGVQVAAVKGEDEILIVLAGLIPEGSTVAADLQHSLAIRKNRLYLHPARLQRIGALKDDARTSSLQHVINLCDGGEAAKTISSASGFLDVYAGCLMRAKGISITNVAAHPSRRLSVIVYSQDALHTLTHMNGTITVLADRTPVRIQVLALREVLPEQKVRPAAFIGSAR